MLRLICQSNLDIKSGKPAFIVSSLTMSDKGGYPLEIDFWQDLASGINLKGFRVVLLTLITWLRMQTGDFHMRTFQKCAYLILQTQFKS